MKREYKILVSLDELELDSAIERSDKNDILKYIRVFYPEFTDTTLVRYGMIAGHAYFTILAELCIKKKII